ncbi:FAD-binding protein [Catellatospora citrea]|uniref:FAD-binding oxidoreductase n=1 Tax=Catellatospora citrea TaxID=53366 RepID=UPI0033E56435
MNVKRRGLIVGAALAGGGASGLLAGTPAAAETAALATQGGVVGPRDIRYPDLVVGGNQRFVGTPDYVHVARSTRDVVDAVQQAVRTGRRLAVRSGGHCYEDFVANESVRVVVDMSSLTGVYYDSGYRAVVVEAGATLSHAYREIFKGWGVVIPAGACPTVGAGGHVPGGGYGPLARQLGLVVDHLYGVEVVVVDATGRARAVVATQEPNDPNRDLWWAHTGGGGGSFGVVTRFLFRTPGATGTDPAGLLPRPPGEVLVSSLIYPWAALDEARFTRLLRNYGGWYERNSGPASPARRLFSQLKPFRLPAGIVKLDVQIDTAGGGAEQLLASFLAEIGDGVGVTPVVSDQRKLPWWHASWWNGFTGGDAPLTQRFKAKSAYHRRTFTQAQASAIFRHMTSTEYANPGGLILISGYGGRVNAVDPAATAVPQRDSILKLHYANFWTVPQEDPVHLDWIRRFYADVYSATGGVPVSNDDTDGTFINYADRDVADPAWNSSGVPWTRLYYGANYPRLQRVKSAYDPLEIFRHALSPRPVGS